MNREIIPNKQIDSQIRLPGSKYIANRLLPLCALANSQSILSNVVDNDDINTSIKGLQKLGYLFEHKDKAIKVLPREKILTRRASVYTAHSGTFSRFVTAMAALEQVPVSIDCSSKMATRPMLEIFDSLNQLGVKIESPNDCLPATISGPIGGNACVLDAGRSSQYLSALLMIAPHLPDGLTVNLSGTLVSRAYVDMTINLMHKMGVEVVEVVKEGKSCFSVAANQAYQGVDYEIPCDPVSSTYFMAAAAISGGKVIIKGFDFESVQGESKFYQVLEKMGVSIESNNKDITVIGCEQLNGVEIDMGGMPDAVQTLAAIACFAKGQTRITNIAHLAFKESNRIEDTAMELRKTGIKVDTGVDYMVIHGGQPQAAEINTHDDHRMAMSMALLGIKTTGIKIMDAQVVEKSFPSYWQYLAKIGLQSELL